MTARRPSFALVLGALVAGAAFWSLGGLELHDESWFLQVTARVAGGESLYRDVFYGATPLAVYAALPLVWILGPQILWVKALVVACFAASLLLLVSIGRRLGATNLELAAVGAALLVWAPPNRSALYQPLATVFLLACLAAALAWLDSGSARTLALAGALAGLAFATKQNVGLLAAAALLATVLFAGRSPRARAAALAVGVFAGTVALTLVPVLATGGLRDLWAYGFAGKGDYADRAHVSYVGGVEGHWWVIRHTGGGIANRVSAAVYGYELVAYVLVPLVLVALAAAWLRARGPERARIFVVGAFALAAALAIFPRADMAHVSVMIPVLLAGALCACKALVPERHLRTAAVVLLVVLGPVLLARALGPVAQLANGSKRFSGLPHTRGVLVEPSTETELANAAATLAREPGPVFVATPEAGILYVVSGIENPTPYDYPLATAFGRDGEARLADEIEDGRFPAVCFDYLGTGPALVPERIAAAIDRSLTPGEDLGLCRVYRRAPR